MSNRQRAYFRGKLLAWRHEILRSTEETRQHLHEESSQYPDLADRASTETGRAVELARRLPGKSTSPSSQIAPSKVNNAVCDSPATE